MQPHRQRPHHETLSATTVEHDAPRTGDGTHGRQQVRVLHPLSHTGQLGSRVLERAHDSSPSARLMSFVWA